MMKLFIALVIPALVVIAAGCSAGPNTESDPQKAVVKMFRAIENNDRQKLAYYLDFPALLSKRDVDYALSDTVRSFNNPEEILDDLLEGGFTNSRWTGLKKVINKSWQTGDSAVVEVSFMDTGKGKTYYTKFGLHRVNEAWKVYSFNVKNN